MPDSIREQIVQAFATRIGATRAMQLDNNSELPARAVWDSSETAERLQYGRLGVTLTLNVGYLDNVDRAVNPSKQGNVMLATLLNDALNNDPTLGGLCSQINYSDSVIDFPEPGQDQIAVLIVFEIVYDIDSTDPFN